VSRTNNRGWVRLRPTRPRSVGTGKSTGALPMRDSTTLPGALPVTYKEGVLAGVDRQALACV
jgi:hypothetical protein